MATLTPTARAEPLNIDSAFIGGATFGGDAVVEIWVRTRRGEEASRTFVPEEVEPTTTVEESEFSPTQRAIIGELGKAGQPLTRKELANRLNYADSTGRFGKVLSGLLSTEVIGETPEKKVYLLIPCENSS